MINIDNKYDIGQKVFLIEKEDNTEKCLNCGGKGFIRNEKLIDFKCHKCKGSGKVLKEDNKWVVSSKSMEIKNIKIYLNKDSFNLKYIVGGYSKKEEELFSSIKTAQDKCDKLNKIN